MKLHRLIKALRGGGPGATPPPPTASAPLPPAPPPPPPSPAPESIGGPEVEEVPEHKTRRGALPEAKIVFGAWVVLSGLLGLLLGGVLFSLTFGFVHALWLSPLSGLATALIGATVAIPFCLLYVDNWQVCVLMNQITNTLRAIGPGIWFKLPWEYLDPDHRIPTELQTVEITDTVPIADGGFFKLVLRILFYPSLRRIFTYTRVEESDQRQIIQAQTLADTREKVQKHTSSEGVITNLDQIREEAMAIYKGRVALIENLCGIDIESVALVSLMPDQATQDKLGKRLEVTSLRKAADALKGVDGDNIRFALIESGKIRVDEQVVHGANGVEQLAGTILALVRRITGDKDKEGGKK